MNSRMDKYYNSSSGLGKRSQKNEELYKKVNQQTLEDFDVNSNVSVLSDNGMNIDLDMLRDMLDKKYRDHNKRKPINIDLPQEEKTINLEQTKEYDINAILEKAKENKTIDYEKERLKKIRDTQYDILKSLNLSKKEDEEESPTPEEEKLMTLINTITINEKNNQKDLDPLDLFQDLKGDENTAVLEGIDKATKQLEQNQEKQIDKSFYTSSFNLSKNDFEDFQDLQDDVKSNKVIVTIITIIIILAILLGIFYFLNIYFKWGII